MTVYLTRAYLNCRNARIQAWQIYLPEHEFMKIKLMSKDTIKKIKVKINIQRL